MSDHRIFNGWIYNGGFEYGEGIFKDSCEDENNWDHHEWLKENGFDDAVYMTLGEVDSNLWANVYADRDSKPNRYLMDLAFNNHSEEPILTNLPGLLQLAKDLTPLIELNMKVEDREEEFHKEEHERKNRGRMIIE